MATTWPPQAAWAVSTESHFRDSGTRRPGRKLGAFCMSGYWSGLRIWLCEGARPIGAALLSPYSTSKSEPPNVPDHTNGTQHCSDDPPGLVLGGPHGARRHEHPSIAFAGGGHFDPGSGVQQRILYSGQQHDG